MEEENKRVAIVGGLRTPFAKANTLLSRYSSLELSLKLINGFVELNEELVDAIDELSFSTVLLNPRYPNLAREIVLRGGISNETSAHFVSNNCISGLVSMNWIFEGIRSGRIKAGLAGGVESMSRPTLTFPAKGEEWFLRMFRANGLSSILKVLLQFRPYYLFPAPPSPKEPSTGLTMGEHMEITAKEMNISREAQDMYALNSHMKAFKAQQEGFYNDEIYPIDGVKEDNLIRPDTSLEKLASLRPVFDRKSGTLTAGNSTALTDGASVVALMDLQFAEEKGFDVKGIIECVQFSAIDPRDGLLLGPVKCVYELLQKANITFDDIDIFEIHEAFAAQVLANRLLWKKGWDRYNIPPIGDIPDEKINISGGSLALGHPFAATGGRLLINAVKNLHKRSAQTCLISVCAAGAMAGAVLVRRV